MKHGGLASSPSVKVWFETLNLPSSGSQILRSPKMIPTALGYDGQMWSDEAQSLT